MCTSNISGGLSWRTTLLRGHLKLQVRLYTCISRIDPTYILTFPLARRKSRVGRLIIGCPDVNLTCLNFVTVGVPGLQGLETHTRKRQFFRAIFPSVWVLPFKIVTSVMFSLKAACMPFSTRGHSHHDKYRSWLTIVRYIAKERSVSLRQVSYTMNSTRRMGKNSLFYHDLYLLERLRSSLSTSEVLR